MSQESQRLRFSWHWRSSVYWGLEMTATLLTLSRSFSPTSDNRNSWQFLLSDSCSLMPWLKWKRLHSALPTQADVEDKESLSWTSVFHLNKREGSDSLYLHAIFCMFSMKWHDILSILDFWQLLKTLNSLLKEYISWWSSSTGVFWGGSFQCFGSY